MTIQQVFTDKVQATQPYHVASSGGMIKLDAMESPYRPPEEMRHALGTALAMTNINRYPNPNSTSLTAKIKNKFKLPEACDVILGNGSDELIQIILMATRRVDAVVLSPAPSFVMYEHYANIFDMRYVGVDLNADFSLDEGVFLSAIEAEKPAVVFLAYPNNPTGHLLDKAFVEKVLQTATGLVVLDEAYSAYAEDSAIDLIAQYENAILIRTLSKIGLAGIRLGYLIAAPSITEQLNKVRMPYNINVLTQATARFMLDQMSFLNKSVEKVLKEKQLLYQWLSDRDDVVVFPSETNFLLVRFNEADKVFRCLCEDYKILVKNLHGVHPVLNNMLRITIGRKKENVQLREALAEILKKL